MTDRLKGKVAIVTGAARGQGEAQARLFAAEGARVVLVDLSPNGDSVAEDIGESSRFLRADISLEADWARVIAATVGAFGKVDILVSNAAIYDPTPLQDTDTAGYDRVHGFNQRGTFLGMKAVIEPMKANGSGSIINISSVAGLRGVPGSFAYAATKWAVRGMSKSASLDLAPFNIRVNSIHPGFIDTAMVAVHDDAFKQQLCAAIPLGRPGEAREVALAALYLASDEASYVTGAELMVSGGL